MKEYKFEEIKVKGMQGLKGTPEKDYKEIIKEQAKEGWELVQIFAPPTGFYGSAPYIEIIFSRDVER
ncbi:DUF4177 domain-containing protein [Priestia aryabhattai]|uniref:DUF4177 domain-containing protein n=1 Tax=Priestia aryabhattai TaxID=412384 RepID=A0AAX6NCQ8_PRIAR|nr:DUF4177 domain-containing protein [Priestia aryabhattai]MDU9693599.1 DUF4177 domain-containing protein [Priestia aryabhattai]